MSTFATPDTAKAWHLDIQGISPQDIIPESLILQTSSQAGFVEGDEPAVRVPYVNIDTTPRSPRKVRTSPKLNLTAAKW